MHKTTSQYKDAAGTVEYGSVFNTAADFADCRKDWRWR
jgi:hypothetical protein